MRFGQPRIGSPDVEIAVRRPGEQQDESRRGGRRGGPHARTGGQQALDLGHADPREQGNGRQDATAPQAMGHSLHRQQVRQEHRQEPRQEERRGRPVARPPADEDEAENEQDPGERVEHRRSG